MIAYLLQEHDIYSWRCSESVLDWRYPLTVDMTLYRKKDIEGDLRIISYHTPNRLEGMWCCRINRVVHHRGLCFEASKVVNMPLNRVQKEELGNRAMDITTLELLAQFNAGKKMDIAQLHNIDNKSAHMEYMPTFVYRS